uniref:Protein quiver n=1 Tax=Photinus pyralis TaxID=7054 RepID=A0A1Y1MTR1_PHOPY
MYFKLVLASIGLLCVGVTSGTSGRYCHSCYGRYDDSPAAFDDCRHFVNITKTDTCSSSAHCIFYYKTFSKMNKAKSVAARFCSDHDCDYFRVSGDPYKHCSQCETDYCNTDKFLSIR